MAMTTAERQAAYRARAGEGESRGAKLVQFEKLVRGRAPSRQILEAASELARRDGQVLSHVAHQVGILVETRSVDAMLGMARLAFGVDADFIRAWGEYLAGPAWKAPLDRLPLLAKMAEAGVMPPVDLAFEKAESPADPTPKRAKHTTKAKPEVEDSVVTVATQADVTQRNP